MNWSKIRWNICTITFYIPAYMSMVSLSKWTLCRNWIVWTEKKKEMGGVLAPLISGHPPLHLDLRSQNWQLRPLGHRESLISNCFLNNSYIILFFEQISLAKPFLNSHKTCLVECFEYALYRFKLYHKFTTTLLCLIKSTSLY